MENKNTKNTKSSDCGFYCEYCNYKCKYIRDWNIHITRPKHITKMNGNSGNSEIQKNTKICSCGKEYNTVSGLWKHQQKCDNNILKHKIENNDTDTDTHPDNDNTIISYHELHNIVLDIVKSNQELQKQNMELQKQMIDVCKNMQPLVSNTINQNNSHNKTFNLQFFLNETCKDAMNISEFIENISLQLSDLENIGKMGYIEGISNIIIQNLRALDVEKRPVHCSDVKREIMYVKDEDKWEKENEVKQKIKQVISAVASKNRNLLPEYKKKYPQCMDPQSKKSDEYNHLIMESLGIGNGVENTQSKIIRKIAKEVVIEKE
jgi:hypothetical protein